MSEPARRLHLLQDRRRRDPGRRARPQRPRRLVQGPQPAGAVPRPGGPGRTTTTTPPPPPPPTRPASGSLVALADEVATGLRQRRTTASSPTPAPAPGRRVFHTHLHVLGGSLGACPSRWSDREPSSRRPAPAPALAAVLATGLLALSACGGRRRLRRPTNAPPSPPTPRRATSRRSPRRRTDGPRSGHDAEAGEVPSALRAGETRTTIAMPGSYTPSAPYGTGTDDYRCFLLDPELDRRRVAHRHAGAARQPRGRAPRDPVPGAARAGRRRRGEGRGRGGRGLDLLRRHRARAVPERRRLRVDRRLGPGGEESVIKPGFGIRLRPGQPRS